MRARVIMVLVAVTCCQPSVPKTPPAPKSEDLQWVYPGNGAVVGGAGILLMVRGTGLESPQVSFEIAPDGKSFNPVILPSAADLGPDLFAARFDGTLLASGPLSIRAVGGDARTQTMGLIIDQPPRPQCQFEGTESGVQFDCSASTDPDGKIVAYHWYFGDGQDTKTETGRVVHLYAQPGSYHPIIELTDDKGLITLDDDENLVLRQDRKTETVKDPTCGCAAMIIHTTNKSKKLRDPRRYDPDRKEYDFAPLGPDNDFGTFNFEVEAMFTANTTAESKCKEGQTAKSTLNVSNGREERTYQKGNCVKGRTTNIDCFTKSECDTNTCQGGGTMNGKSCDGFVIQPRGTAISNAMQCLLEGGTCKSNHDGECKPFPFTGAEHGEDGYNLHFPGDGLKTRYADDKGPRWFDAPGYGDGSVSAKGNYDFIAVLDGAAGKCSCHFQIQLDFDGTERAHRTNDKREPLSKLEIVKDKDSANCTMD